MSMMIVFGGVLGGGELARWIAAHTFCSLLSVLNTRANIPDKLSQTKATKLIGFNTIAPVLPDIIA